MKTLKIMAAVIIAAVVAVSCGTTKPVAKVSNIPPVPSVAEASEIASSICGTPSGSQVVFALESSQGPKVVGFRPAVDSGYVRVSEIGWDKDKWAIENVVDYPCLDGEGFKFKSFADSSEIRSFGGEKYLVFRIERESDKEYQKSVLLYNPEIKTLQQVSFTGIRKSDGKIEGQTNLNLLPDSGAPQIVWAADELVKDPHFTILSEADIMTDQAIEWWLKNNPKALSSASKIVFGSLPAESSLAVKFSASAKENGSKYRAALFDLRGYTVVVAQKKADGSYILAWAEPVCTNKKTGRLLNSIYFEKENNLVLFYYKGKTTFKYRLNLSSGKLVR